MKKGIVRRAGYFTSVKTVALSLMFTFNTAAFSQPFSDDNPLLKSATVKHLGLVNNKQYFQVALHNEKGEKYCIIIKDGHGFELYKETFIDKAFNRKFQLEKMDDDFKYTFIIRTLKDNQSQSFEINNRMIEEIIVKRM